MSLLEILVAVTVLSLIMVGVLNVFLMSNNRSAISNKQNVAAEFAKGLLDSLLMQVDQRNWTGNCLGAGTGCATTAQTVGSLSITPLVILSNVGTNESIVKVRLTVTYVAPH